MSSGGSRPYHHGDLRRALMTAASRLLESEGPEALSLRAVARAAGVSPAAPYHHFRDKGELLAAVADQGFEALAQDIRKARDASATGSERMTAIGVAYASFALRHGALYRVMSGTARTRSRLLPPAGESEVVHLMGEAVRQSRAPGASEDEVQMAAIAAWAALHGLAELAAFKVLDPIKAEAGGEQAFLHEVVRHLGVVTGR